MVGELTLLQDQPVLDVTYSGESGNDAYFGEKLSQLEITNEIK
jgi:hypothetical protein